MKRKLLKLANELNGVIHSRNLYLVTTPQNRRVINAHVKEGKLFVTDLYSEQSIEVVANGNTFIDGYGKEVSIFSL